MGTRLRPLAAACLALAAMLPAHASRAEVTGTVHELVNPDAPREAWVRKPLPDAYVVLTWTITIPAPGHATTTCRHAEIARTDRDGRYAMEGPGFVTAGLADTRALVYAPGRDRLSFPHPGSPVSGNDFTVAKSARSPEARLTSLSGYASPGCGGWERPVHDPGGLMKTYLESLLAEARTLNVDTLAGKNALAHIAAAVKYSDPANRAPPPMKVVPMPVGRAQMQQKNAVPATPSPSK